MTQSKSKNRFLNAAENVFELDQNIDLNDFIKQIDGFAEHQYPKQPAKPRLVSTTPTAEQTEEYLRLQKKYVVDYEDYKMASDRYNLEQNDINEAKEYFVKQYNGFFSYVPEKYQANVWSLAWSRGHHAGYSEVSSNLSDLIQIFQ